MLLKYDYCSKILPLSCIGSVQKVKSPTSKSATVFQLSLGKIKQTEVGANFPNDAFVNLRFFLQFRRDIFCHLCFTAATKAFR